MPTFDYPDRSAPDASEDSDRARLIRAARAILQEGGLAALTRQALASQTGLGLNVVSGEFRTREDLLMTITDLGPTTTGI